MATLMAGHRKMEESKQVRDDPSTTQALKTHQGRAQGADQAPLAAIARVSAAKSETWILVLCLRMYSMKGVLTRRKVYSVFSTVFLLLLLLVVAVGCPAACFG